MFYFITNLSSLYDNKHIDISFSAHDTFLELPSSDTLKVDRLENQIM